MAPSVQPNHGLVSNGMDNISRFITTVGSAGFADTNFSQSITWEQMKGSMIQRSGMKQYADNFEKYDATRNKRFVCHGVPK